ncbi:MAG TPA: 4-(cytidine 5'-diphospho)-2-C-methyl-D-erythritol kinase [Bacillota bacterium]|nr:4-(cytidine 5'-diphospho)-2-C-methyl-D-erythritol kinase [Bacillota bacterium]
MNCITEAAPAKINLYLDILSKRPDGYHNIVSIMQAVSLSDTVRIELQPGSGINLLVSGDSSVPVGRENLAYRAAELFLKMANVDCRLDIEVEKVIPAAAGLGGGSSDAAAVLRGLNRLFGRPFSYAGLCKMGLSLGADLPFCIAGGCALVEGIGEKLTPIPVMPEATILVASAGEGMPTPEAYAKLDLMYGNFKKKRTSDDHRQMLEAISARDIRGVCGCMYNIFEDCIIPEHPKAAEIKQIKLGSGACAAQMSGSGPAVFGIFTDKEAAKEASKQLADKNITSYSCIPVKPFGI